MASLTLKGIPDQLLDRLRTRAAEERRSLNQHAIRLIEQALAADRPGFAGAYGSFRARYGDTPLADGDFETQRDADDGRAGVDFES
jgi:hypothetical protein